MEFVLNIMIIVWQTYILEFKKNLLQQQKDKPTGEKNRQNMFFFILSDLLLQTL